jgi:LacI family transcriptional regulator
VNYTKSTHLYRQIIQDLKLKINDGKLPVGTQIDTHKQLALNYNVSLITVKKAIDELVNEGFLTSKAGKGTFVVNTEGKIKENKSIQTTNTIGFVLRDLQNPFFSLIAHEIELLAHHKGYTTLIANSSDNFEKEENIIRQLKNSGASGLIIASMAQKYFASETIRSLHREKFPYVMVSYIHDKDIYFVGTDHIHGGFLATEHLIKEGYKSIGYINSPMGNLTSDLRRIGYFKAFEYYKKTVNPDHIYYLRSGGGWQYYTAGAEIGKLICKTKNRPDAFFVYNDLVALGFQRAILDSGLIIPDDIAIVGYDDIELASLARVPLTTIRQPVKKIATQALRVITAQVESNKPEYHTILKPELVIRNSTIKQTQ